MRFGLFLTNEHPVGADMVAALTDQLRFTAAAVEGGWHSIFTGQHYVSAGTQRLQPIAFLARLAAEAPGLTFGTGVHLFSLGNPVAMAEEFATLDVITGGRAVAGLGLGYRDEEFAAFGIDKTRRAKRFERNLEIARELWSGHPVTVDEEWCRLDAATIGTPPVNGDIPVWIGGTSVAAIRRAGRVAEGWMINPAASSEALGGQARAYRAEAQASGRGGGYIGAFREVYVAATTHAALETAMPLLARKYQVYNSWGQERGHASEQRLDGPAEEVGRGRFTVGDPAHVVAELRRFRDEVGVDEFILRTEWPGMSAADALASIDLLSREVLPALAER